MSIYTFLSGFRWLNRYSAKFLFVGFLGIHIPLLGVIAFTLLSDREAFGTLTIVLVVLGLTLLATAATLFVLNQLLAPLILTKTALEQYLVNKVVPNLPTQYGDEAGVLMRKVQSTVTTLNDLLNAKREMIAVLSRDMHTPLGQMIMAAQLIKSEKPDPVVVEQARRIVDSGRKQLNALEHVLELLQQGDLEVRTEDLQPVALRKLLDELRPNLEATFADKPCSVATDFPDDFTLCVKKDLFREALQHVLQHALLHTPTGGEVRVSARQHDGQATVEIADSGSRLDSSHAERLFERFTKPGQHDTPERRTLGMGLYLSRKIVERHQGQLHAHNSRTEAGVTFVISLPLCAPDILRRP